MHINDVNGPWQPGPSARVGVSTAALTAWEREHGVQLPKRLKSLLRRQNGGFLRDSDIRVIPLHDMKPPQTERLGHVNIRDLGELRLLVGIAEDISIGGTYFLDYNRCSARGEPAVVSLYTGVPEFQKEADSLNAFLATMFADTKAPTVDWSEIDRLEMLADDVVDPHTHNVLCRAGSNLILFVRHTVNKKDRGLERTTLPLPLKRRALVSLVSPRLRVGRRRYYHNDKLGPWTLELEPIDRAGIVQRISDRVSTGWRTHDDVGSPFVVEYESWDKAKLKTLSSELARLR